MRLLSDISVKIINLYDAGFVCSRLLSTDDDTSLGLDFRCGLLLLFESCIIFKIFFTKDNGAYDVEGEVCSSVHPHLDPVENPEDKQLIRSKLWILVWDLREFSDLPKLVKFLSWVDFRLGLIGWSVLNDVSNHHHFFFEENNWVNSRIISEFNLMVEIYLINIDCNVAWRVHIEQKSLKSFNSLLFNK